MRSRELQATASPADQRVLGAGYCRNLVLAVARLDEAALGFERRHVGARELLGDFVERRAARGERLRPAARRRVMPFAVLLAAIGRRDVADSGRSGRAGGSTSAAAHPAHWGRASSTRSSVCLSGGRAALIASSSACAGAGRARARCGRDRNRSAATICAVGQVGGRRGAAIRSGRRHEGEQRGDADREADRGEEAEHADRHDQADDDGRRC